LVKDVVGKGLLTLSSRLAISKEGRVGCGEGGLKVGTDVVQIVERRRRRRRRR